MRVKQLHLVLLAQSGQGKDVPCRIDVAMKRHSAGADMLALSQAFLDHLAAVAASLAVPRAFHFHNHDASCQIQDKARFRRPRIIKCG